ncbi:MAG: DUF805 domain-containing protein [Brevundimonas sp.]|nr:MAG: DUF805 domain-containing protein [Brevundimonas sp.]
MRGEILLFSDSTGRGIVSGDDGGRYSFDASDIIGGRPAWGSRVDFVPEGDVATLLVVMETTPVSLENLPPPAPRLTSLGHFKRCCTTAYLLGEGRAGMTEFWSFTLIQFGIMTLVWVPVMAISFLLAMTAIFADATGDSFQALPGVMLVVLLPLILLSLFFIAPSICAKIRRLHDTGKSAWWVLLIFVPFGGLALLIMALAPSQPGPNQFGHPPL